MKRIALSIAICLGASIPAQAQYYQRNYWDQYSAEARQQQWWQQQRDFNQRMNDLREQNYQQQMLDLQRQQNNILQQQLNRLREDEDED
jgi:hypothetical protein